MLPKTLKKFSSMRTPAYRRIDSEALLAEKDGSDSGLEGYTHPPSPSRYDIQHILTLACLFFFMFVSIFLGFAYQIKVPSTSQCVDQTSLWSPANTAVEYQEFDFDNDFGHKTKYRGPPTPELERAWEELWWYNGVRFPANKLALINRTQDLGEGRTPREAVDGKGGYHVMIDVFHQLHCLNLIRQYTWHDYYKTHTHIVATPVPFHDSDVGIRLHLDHCIETLRLTLMCHGDTTPSLAFNDPESPIGISTDFSAHRKCRNFERIREWTEEHQIQKTTPMNHEPGAEVLGAKVGDMKE